MNKETCMKEAEESILHTYNRFPVVFDHGEGVYLYDTDGKEYLDFAAGIAVQAFGYHNREYSEALKTQVDKLMHTSNLFYNEPITSAAKRVLKASQMDRVFFTNSGTEAIEGALKAAKKYAYTRDGHAGHEIIAMNHSFHGRSLGALSVTGNKHYQEPFEPLIPGIRFAEFNQLDSVKALINEKTCAIILETVQGEGGIYPATDEFLQGVRALCDEHDILLILDEIGRGTSTYDGLSIAWAVVEHISNPKLLGAKTLFATHYHELTELEGKLNNVNNYCVAVKEKGDDIVFLRKIVKGGADKSYGIQVAKLAGVPDSVIARAKEIVEELSANDITEVARNISVDTGSKKKKEKLDEVDLTQMSLFDTVRDDDIIEELRNVDVGNLTPIEALNKLYELQNKVKNRW